MIDDDVVQWATLIWFIGLVLFILGIVLDPSLGDDVRASISAWFNRKVEGRSPEQRVALRWVAKVALMLGILITPGSGLIMLTIATRNVWRNAIERERSRLQAERTSRRIVDELSSSRGTDDSSP